jgi:hypothetical protein
MEAGLMAAWRFSVPVIAMAAALTARPVLADGLCDLNTVVGYQIAFAKPIAGYIQGGMRKKGYEGCEPDRVLVFADNTGVKCKTDLRQPSKELPTGYLFFRGAGDLKLCVDGELFDVSPTN